MDTTDARPPADPSATHARAWWRQPLADLFDVLLVTVSGVLVGGVAAGVLVAGTSDDPWAPLGVAFVGVSAGLAAAAVTWLVLLVTVARGGRTPGARAVALPGGRVLAAAARHVVVVVVLWTAGAVVAAASEPWPAGPLGGAVAAGVATGAALATWGRGPRAARLRVVGAASLAGLLDTGVVPDRAPYPWELRREAEAAVRATLEHDPVTRRACELASGGAPIAPIASHATQPCHDPDREWLVERHPTVVAERIVAVTAEAVSPHAAVRLVDRHGGEREVLLDAVPVATVAPSGCGSVVVVGPGPSSVVEQLGEGCP